MVSGNITRRKVLQGIGAGGFAATAAGIAAADEGRSALVVGTTGPSGTRAARRQAESVKREFDFGDIGEAVAGEYTDESARELRGRDDVRYVEHDGTMRALDQTLPWGIDRVDAEVAHNNGETGSGADVAIIDTGIDSDHSDLEANLGAGEAFVACGDCSCFPPGFSCGNGNDCDEPWDDDNNHGTHCAGIADADDNTEGVVGVSTQATLHAVKVLDCGGSGSYSDVAAGIEYVADQGWDVGSMSLGGSKSSVVEDACEYAYGEGVLLVAAAGNAGPCTDCVSYPAAEPEVVAVSATDQNDDLADFSSQGPEVELAAPGVDILSTIPGGYDKYSGTSMSCPHVSGAGGQLMANGYTNVDARDHLKQTAEDIGLSSDEQGAGLLDVAASLGFDSSDDLNDGGGDGGGGDTNVAVSTSDATNVGDTSATLNGSLDDLGGASSADCSFEWGESGAGFPNATTAQNLSTTGSFSEDLTTLTSSTEYEFRAVADASDGDSDTGSTLTFTTTGGSSGDTAPVIDSYTVTEAGSPNPHADITADWTVSDADGDLDTVVVEVIDADTGSVVADSTTNVGGDTASGTDEFKIKFADGETFEVTLTVTDAGGLTDSETDTVEA